MTEQRDIIEKLRKKYKQVCSELQDIEHEEAGKREGLLEMVREQQKELDFISGVVKMMLKDQEIFKIKERVKFNFD